MHIYLDELEARALLNAARYSLKHNMIPLFEIGELTRAISKIQKAKDTRK